MADQPTKNRHPAYCPLNIAGYTTVVWIVAMVLCYFWIADGDSGKQLEQTTQTTFLVLVLGVFVLFTIGAVGDVLYDRLVELKTVPDTQEDEPAA